MPRKSKSGRVARIMKKKEPQIVEGDKVLLAIRGQNTSASGYGAMHDLFKLKQPDAILMSRKNDILPFEDATSVEFLAQRNEAAAFIFTSHNKKRPNNLVLGRLYDGHILDMIELGVDAYSGIDSFDSPGKMFGAKPCMVFQGEEWDRSAVLMKLRNLFLDVWGARNMKKIALKGIDHVLVVTAQDSKVYFRGYSIGLLKSGTRVPDVELTPMGPSIDFSLRRSQLASTDLEKASLRVPSILKPKKVKNVSTDTFGTTLGRIHMEAQDFDKLELRKTKALKVSKKMAKAAAAGGAGAEADADAEDGSGGGSGDVHSAGAASAAAREAEAEMQDSAAASSSRKGTSGRSSGQKRKRADR